MPFQHVNRGRTMYSKTNMVFVLIVFFLLFSAICPRVSVGADGGANDLSLDIGIPKAASANTAASEEMSLLDLIKKGGIVGYLLILLSVVSLGLIIDYLFTIRKSKIFPAKDVDQLWALIENRDFQEIDNIEHGKLSFLSKVTIAGLKEVPHGYPAMIKAMEDTSEALSSGIARKTEHLNVIGNISPMLGLLGTVIGMLRCFNEIAHTTGAIEPKQLAGGIFEALITTCMGLIVAIPALYCYAVFRNRVDEYTGEAALQAEQLVASFRHERGEK